MQDFGTPPAEDAIACSDSMGIDRRRYCKGFVLMTGDVASVEASVAAGCAIALEEGILVGSGVIAAPSKELFRQYV
jgi:microcompartment protein CcmL/EutN